MFNLSLDEMELFIAKSSFKSDISAIVAKDPSIKDVPIIDICRYVNEEKLRQKFPDHADRIINAIHRVSDWEIKFGNHTVVIFHGNEYEAFDYADECRRALPSWKYEKTISCKRIN